MSANNIVNDYLSGAMCTKLAVREPAPDMICSLAEEVPANLL